MTDEVAQLVLRRQRRSERLDGHRRANAASLRCRCTQCRSSIWWLERGVNRELKHCRRRRRLPGAPRRHGLPARILATLMAHVKLGLKEEVLATELAGSGYQAQVASLFPDALRERFTPEIRSHQLPRDRHHHADQRSADTAGITGMRSGSPKIMPIDAVRPGVATDAIFGVNRLLWRRIRAANPPIALSTS